ncbi:MAG: glycerophosphoryl diester phosphodiesterase membrane domain-containing protein [Leucobacter sp.]|nr:glycerophosphoryl diester phosphodiesterase membrane domain-containing protein [Leucobacter sp.]
MHRINPFPVLRAGWRAMRVRWAAAAWVTLGVAIVITLVASPLISWLFREALRANGMMGLDLGRLSLTGGIGVTLVLILVILLLAFWLITFHFALLIIILQRAVAGAPLHARSVWRGILGVARKLVRPSSFPLFLYLLLVVPLSGFGFLSVLSRGISIPTFISDELLKSTAGTAVWYVFLAALAFVNLRFALSLPIFTLTDATGGRAMRESWRLTAGWAGVRLVLAGLILVICAAVATGVLVAVAILPTMLSDALAPAASPWIAAFSLGIAQMLGLLLTCTVTATLVGMLLALLRERRAATADAGSGSAAAAAPDPAPSDRPSGSRRPITVFAGVCAVLALLLGIVHLDTMRQLSSYPETLVFGHRGFSDGGVENTIGGLEAAHGIGVDFVEIDVMQTKDGGFIVMHDASLERLTGRAVMVKDLTLDEVTAMTVRDQFGHEDTIPSLAAYVTRAIELEQPLLIEIKFSGAERPDHVEQLVQELESLDGMSGNIFHTLDYASAERLKQLRPDATVGYILSFAGGGVPETSADFLVIEELSATVAMQRDARDAGLGFVSWTVNDEEGMRDLLRRGADGIISDHPDLVLAARTEMQGEQGLAGVLLDAMTRFVVAW